jgi:hypothetical protein
MVQKRSFATALGMNCGAYLDARRNISGWRHDTLCNSCRVTQIWIIVAASEAWLRATSFSARGSTTSSSL